MSQKSPRRILIVDDDAVFCEVATRLLRDSGYEVRCAEDGFEGLAMLKEQLPDLIISDLNMPRMSGFEFLSIVRRRHPHIPVVIVSGEFVGSEWPTGVIADAYFQKGGEHSPTVLVNKIRELLEKSTLRPQHGKTGTVPVWIPLTGKDYFVLTCVHCLRSFSLPVPKNGDLQKASGTAACEFCGNEVQYVLDLALVEEVKRDQV